MRELVEVYLAVSVFINFFNHVLPNFVALIRIVSTEDIPKLFCADFTIAVLVEHPEGSLKVLKGQKFLIYSRQQ